MTNLMQLQLKDVQLYHDGEIRVFTKGTNLFATNQDCKTLMGAPLKRVGSMAISFRPQQTHVLTTYEVDWKQVNQSKILWRDGDLVGFKSYSNPRSTDPTIYLLKVDLKRNVVVDWTETYRRRNGESSFFS